MEGNNKEEVLEKLEKFKSIGIDGVECYYPANSEMMTETCVEFCKNNDMIITVENYISKSVLNDNKELHTSKQDKKSHGLGTQIIKKLVKKNNGTCDYHEEGNMFCCEIRW